MTLRQLAAYLQLGPRSVYRLAQRGELPGRKVLGRWRFHQEDVDAWLRQVALQPRDEERSVLETGDPAAGGRERER